MRAEFLRASAFTILVGAMGTVGFTAKAEGPPFLRDSGRVTSALYNCNMDFHASGKSIYIGIGYTELNGEGTLSCYDPGTGAIQRIPLKITARGPGAGLGVTGLNLSGGATGIGITGAPEKLLGHYAVIRGNAAIGVGAAAGAGLRLSNGAAVINVNFQTETGLGAGIDLLWIDIKANGQTAETREQTAPRLLDPAPRPVTVPDVPTTVVELHGDQPIQIVDSSGKVIQLIYVKQK